MSNRWSIAELVRTLHRRHLTPRWLREQGTAPLPEAAAALAMIAHGVGAVDELPPIVNVAALSVASKGRPRLFAVRPSASAAIHETDLHSLPESMPALLREPGTVDIRHPIRGPRLFGDVVSLGWYHHAGAVYLIGLRYPDGIMVARWTPRWEGGEIEDGTTHPVSVDVDAEEHRAFVIAAVRYLVTFAVLAEAERAPIVIRPDREDRSHADVYLGDHPRPPPAAGDGASVDVGGEPPGAVPGLVEVGHLKRQRHGPGLALTKWIYVAGHGARRWCDPRYLVTRRSEWRPWAPRQDADQLGDGGRSREG